ncbi:S9 family peptidase [Erythrobacter insulae]|uniref:S9 family peptidase n=1 Tax=Erythrobacter insulae TaxID=2584124 RepID=A0A547PCQ0_9SPHN|nr:S9 family peptidase [Erythrobacter insulae]TRD11909.1 S9 family peptidase [Erythrobacter insulae]
MRIHFQLAAAVSLMALSAPAIAHEERAAAASAQASAEAEAVKTYTAEQFYNSTAFGLGSSGGHVFSADGEYVLINSDRSGVFNAYLLPVGGGEPIALTDSTTNAIFASTFFPDDNRIIYGSDGGGDELNHVYLRELDGSVRDLTPGEGHTASFAGWSADGESFYVSSNERNPQAFDIYVYDADDYSRELLFENPGQFFPGDMSDDGRWMVVSRNNSSADSDLFLVDLQGDKTPKLITEHEGNISYGSYGFTRDSSKLIYATNELGEFNQAMTYDLATGETAPYLKADWDVSFVSFSPSGRYRVSGVNADALTEVTLLDQQSGTEVALTGVPEGNLGGIRFSEDESRIAFTLSSDTSPSDIYVADLASGEAMRLTSALNPAIDEDDLVTATIGRFASYDGVEVPGVLYRPHGADAENPVPAIVWVHGGPGGQSRRGYNPAIQHLVNNGYAVYAINNRGSSGYGKTFFHMDDKRHGDADLKDVVASKAYLQGMDWVADDRIAIMGGSYGGYMVAAALAFEPEVFDAGVNIFGVTNWVRTLKSIPAWWGANRIALYDELGDPETDEERLRAISPLFHASNIVKPMLVVQGANDPRVLQVESDELVAAVKANGVPVEYVLFEDEGHGFRKKENRIEASEAYLTFVDEHIGR